MQAQLITSSHYASTTCLHRSPTPVRASAQICRTADGYQPHLVSPEKGMRSLASEALSMVENPVKETIQEVYSLLIAAAR